jgi:hypothetical protein
MKVQLQMYMNSTTICKPRQQPHTVAKHSSSVYPNEGACCSSERRVSTAQQSNNVTLTAAAPMSRLVPAQLVIGTSTWLGQMLWIAAPSSWLALAATFDYCWLASLSV